jgi:hypothetical protein
VGLGIKKTTQVRGPSSPTHSPKPILFFYFLKGRMTLFFFKRQ